MESSVMGTKPKTSERTGDVSLIVRSDWSVGPRTAAWDRLWRMILSDIGAIPATDARQTLESEVGDA